MLNLRRRFVFTVIASKILAHHILASRLSLVKMCMDKVSEYEYEYDHLMTER